MWFDDSPGDLLQSLLQCWGTTNVGDVLEVARRCRKAIFVLRHPVREKIENAVLPAGIREVFSFNTHELLGPQGVDWSQFY